MVPDGDFRTIDNAPFGPAIASTDPADDLDRILTYLGRSPQWKPPVMAKTGGMREEFMTTTSLGTWTGQPPITPGSGILSTDWVPSPSDGAQSPVVVSFTDFHSDSDEEWQQIAALGIKLAESWPIMRGAVGLWLWGKHVDLRGGSLSVWTVTRICVVSSGGPFTSRS